MPVAIFSTTVSEAFLCWKLKSADKKLEKDKLQEDKLQEHFVVFESSCVFFS